MNNLMRQQGRGTQHMAMRCPNCGNEVGPGETFCGQCGTPNIPPAQPTELMNSQSMPSGALSNGYGSLPPSIPNAYNSGMHPSSSPSHTFYGGGQSAPSGPLYSSSPIIASSEPQQQSGFYNEATEAMSSLAASNNQNFQMGYPQQPQMFIGRPNPGEFPGANQYRQSMSPFQASNYASPPTMYSPPPPFINGQNYQRPPDFPPQKKQNNTVLIIICICLSVAIISVAAFGAIYLLHNNSSKAHNKTASHPTSVITATAASNPSPMLSPTASSTPSPTPSPSPSPAATSTPPDPGFTWCDTTCTQKGYIVEYPAGWQEASTSDNTGIQFTNPTSPDMFAAFKTPGPATGTADQLVDNDLNNFASQPGYMPPTSSSSTTIAGENWVYKIASYQVNNQQEQIEVYATVHQGLAYIIELQASTSQFDAANTQYFEYMLGRFQFQQATP